eukprot:m.10932 g.10932  ORF g.10932 m.10932 type:complete len:124 (-) comp4351_c0_seq1:681-1052(-)
MLVAEEQDFCPHCIQFYSMYIGQRVFPIGPTVVQMSMFARGSSNSSECKFTVTVVDSEEPSLQCPANDTMIFTTDLKAPSRTVTLPAPRVVDNVDGLPTLLMQIPGLYNLERCALLSWKFKRH